MGMQLPDQRPLYGDEVINPVPFAAGFFSVVHAVIFYFVLGVPPQPNVIAVAANGAAAVGDGFSHRFGGAFARFFCMVVCNHR